MFCCALAQKEQKLSGLFSIEFNHSIPSILRGRLEPPCLGTTTGARTFLSARRDSVDAARPGPRSEIVLIVRLWQAMNATR
jgi:hypothetical protein